ncbi:MAG: phosphoserine phosphatase, partial [Methanomicrobiales archaeon HGW-Methanomicrobiales-5]
KQFITCQKELRDYDKVISGLRKKTRKTKVTKEQKAVRKEAERVFQMFREGEKITTDDLLLLQRAKLI